MPVGKHSTLGSHSTTKTNNSEDECSSIMSGSGKHAISAHLNSGNSSASPLKSDVFNELLAQVNVLKEDIQLLQSEMQDRKDENQRVAEEFEAFKSQVQSEYSIFHQNLQEERYRFEVSRCK
jgi:molecular chaperone GrpE (heat shock protein)